MDPLWPSRLPDHLLRLAVTWCTSHPLPEGCDRLVLSAAWSSPASAALEEARGTSSSRVRWERLCDPDRPEPYSFHLDQVVYAALVVSSLPEAEARRLRAAGALDPFVELVRLLDACSDPWVLECALALAPGWAGTAAELVLAASRLR